MQIAFGIGLAIAVTALSIVLFRKIGVLERARHLTRGSVSAAGLAATLLAAVFVTLVTTGVTGSSLSLLYGRASIVETDLRHVAMSPRGIRGDEWLVVTPLAIGQTNHVPPLPIVNKNLGAEGQNMLVVGMTGVPVNHVSALAKPATWGFHIFDVKRALAWFWWFPVFAGLFGLWWLFSVLFPGDWRLGLALSTLYCFSSYAIGWSNWPSYAVFFPSLILCSAVAILKKPQDVGRLAGFTLVLSFALAGFVLILYPPWQIALGWLYGAMALGLVFRDHRQMALSKAGVAAFIVATVMAGAIVWLWWLDARSAVDAMMRTIYPGQRETLTGGELDLPGLLRGFTNIGSLYKLGPDSSTNESEMASYYYLWLPLVVGLLLQGRKSTQHWPLSIAVSTFTAFALLYMLNGIPLALAQATAWGRVPAVRADLALGLSYIVLCGCLLSGATSAGAQPRPRAIRLVEVVSAGVWTLVVAYALAKLPQDTKVLLTHGIALALLSATFFAGLWLVKRDSGKFIGLSLCMTGATTLVFHPVSIAPAQIEPAATLRQVLASAKDQRGRVLTLDSHVPAMALMSAGVAVTNGVFYYPQMRFWNQLGTTAADAHVFNRYHHLSLWVDENPSASSTFSLKLRPPDVVRVLVSARDFDFCLTGADLVLAPTLHEKELRQNKTLNFLRDIGDGAWYGVDRCARGAEVILSENKP